MVSFKSATTLGPFVFILLLASSFPSYATEKLKVASWTSERMPHQSSAGYSYIALGDYDGGRVASRFYRLLGKTGDAHHLWWDTGLIIFGSSAGYRYVFDQRYLGQKWFGGVYLAYDFYDAYGSSSPKQWFYRKNIGFEWGASQLGQLTVNIYGFPKLQMANLPSLIEEYYHFRKSEWISCPLNLLDHGGISVKWTSIPHRSSVQVSAMFAHSQIQRRGIDGFSPENVWCGGVGLQFVLSQSVSIELKYIPIDTHKGWHIRAGLKSGDTKVHLLKDSFQGRLRRPPERPITQYSGWRPNLLASVFSSSENIPAETYVPPSKEKPIVSSSSRRIPKRKESQDLQESKKYSFESRGNIPEGEKKKYRPKGSRHTSKNTEGPYEKEPKPSRSKRSASPADSSSSYATRYDSGPYAKSGGSYNHASPPIHPDAPLPYLSDSGSEEEAYQAPSHKHTRCHTKSQDQRSDAELRNSRSHATQYDSRSGTYDEYYQKPLHRSAQPSPEQPYRASHYSGAGASGQSFSVPLPQDNPFKPKPFSPTGAHSWLPNNGSGYMPPSYFYPQPYAGYAPPPPKQSFRADYYPGVSYTQPLPRVAQYVNYDTSHRKASAQYESKPFAETWSAPRGTPFQQPSHASHRSFDSSNPAQSSSSAPRDAFHTEGQYYNPRRGNQAPPINPFHWPPPKAPLDPCTVKKEKVPLLPESQLQEIKQQFAELCKKILTSSPEDSENNMKLFTEAKMRQLSPATRKEWYHKASLKCHPDKVKEDDKDKAMKATAFQTLNACNDILQEREDIK